MTLKAVGTFSTNKRSKTGRIYVPASLVRDSQFPLKEGRVEIEICLEKCGDTIVCIKPKTYKE